MSSATWFKKDNLPEKLIEIKNGNSSVGTLPSMNISLIQISPVTHGRRLITWKCPNFESKPFIRFIVWLLMFLSLTSGDIRTIANYLQIYININVEVNNEPWLTLNLVSKLCTSILTTVWTRTSTVLFWLCRISWAAEFG